MVLARRSGRLRRHEFRLIGDERSASAARILAWHRPRNPIGWLFAAGGVGVMRQQRLAQHRIGSCAASKPGAPMAVQRLVITIFVWSWPLADRPLFSR